MFLFYRNVVKLLILEKHNGNIRQEKAAEGMNLQESKGQRLQQTVDYSDE